jgi:hypothetical protein
MPRTKKAEHTTPAAAEAAPTTDTVTLEPLPPAAKAAADKPAYAADPHEKISVSISDIPGGPEMHLLRSHKYKHYAESSIM